SQQRPPTDESKTGGRREFIVPVAKCARVAGADGIYCEVHPKPDKAKSDNDTQLDFNQFERLVYEVSQV
ncbi:MAG: 3-deoxy-8-phosphooctulonate synthase, partial [Elusimicrobiota bacterium]